MPLPSLLSDLAFPGAEGAAENLFSTAEGVKTAQRSTPPPPYFVMVIQAGRFHMN